MDVLNLCRGCMREIVSWESDIFDQKLAEMYCFCTRVEITKDDNLPKHFCKDCVNKLESSYAFIKKAKEVNITLLNLISGQTTSVIIKPGHYYEKQQKNYEFEDKNVNYDNMIFNDYSFDNNTETEIQVEIDCLKKPVFDGKSTEHIIEETANNSENINTDETQKICPICNNIFTSELLYEKHLEKDKCFRNKECNKITEASNINNKYNVKGLDEKEPKPCPMCTKTFTSKLWFSRHVERDHGSTQYICEHCSKSFPTHRRLLYHADTHTSERRFPCSACGKRFKKRKQLTAHALSHADERPYACDLCDMTFKIKSILTSHLKVHENEKPFLCSICGRGFRTASHLECHTRLHTGVKPFACSQCAFRARFTASLRRHELRHRADRRHVCERCQKGFYESGALARHMRTHTGERPFQCPNCPRAFADSSKRKVHMMRVHQLSLEDIPRLHRDGRVMSDVIN